MPESDRRHGHIASKPADHSNSESGTVPLSILKCSEDVVSAAFFGDRGIMGDCVITAEDKCLRTLAEKARVSGQEAKRQRTGWNSAWNVGLHWFEIV